MKGAWSCDAPGVSALAPSRNHRQSCNVPTSEDLTMSKAKDKGSSETDEPWKLPGQSSQQPEQKGPPKRNVDRDYGGNKSQTT